MKKPLAMIALAAITLLPALSVVTEALAIDVYHFLVQYKNGRVAEKISTLSGENYKNCYEGYVANIVLLKKKEFTLQQFSLTFGPKNYHRLMVGHFGFGPEEQIIFNRNAGGLDVNPLALPPPGEKSKALAKELDRLLNGDHRAGNGDPADKSTLADPDPLPSQGDEPNSLANWSLREKDIDLPVDPHPESPKESDEKESYHPKIDVYRFLVEYINGETVEKVSTQLPEEYHKQYRGYVRKVASLGKKTYTVRKFKETFGEKSYNLLIQGLFGKDDTDIVMENRMRRGIAPRASALPASSKESIQLAQRLKELTKIQNP
ncbi:MAG: hypothetical protein J7M20_06965 [Deltaproteobacteria bacterium]|nr:hypothetical protein [Deltaproteobacteria bacterium]